MEEYKGSVHQEIEETQVKRFRIYLYLPKILAWSIVLLFFVWGIIDAVAFESTVSTGWYSREYRYGIMQLESSFLCWFIWMLIGTVISLFVYFLGRIKASYKILHILYLQNLLGEKVKEENRVDWMLDLESVEVKEEAEKAKPDGEKTEPINE